MRKAPTPALTQFDMVDFCDALEEKVKQSDSSFSVRLQVMPGMPGDIYVVTIENASTYDQYHVEALSGTWVRVIHG